MYVRRSACGVIFGSGAMPRSVRISFARIINAALGQASLGREEVKRLMTIHGVWDRRDRRLAGGHADDLASCLSAWVRRRRCGCKRIGNRHPALVARALAIEVSLIAAAATQAAARTRPQTGDASAYSLIVLLACAMSLRSATVESLDVRICRRWFSRGPSQRWRRSHRWRMMPAMPRSGGWLLFWRCSPA